MFQDVIDALMLDWYGLYEHNKDKIAEDDEFNKSKERKKMDEFVAAIVLLHSSKYGRP